MRYYVISQDGQRYGPADIATLNQWATEGRLLPHQMLEDEASGQRVPASSVEGIAFPAQQTQQPGYAPGQPYQQHYARPGAVGDDGSKEMTPAWIFGVLSLLCMCCYLGLVFGGLGIYYSTQAQAKGHPSAMAAKILSIVGLALSIIITILSLVLQFTGDSIEGFPNF